MTDTESPRFEVGDPVLVDQGLSGGITDVRRGAVPGVLGEPPIETWLYNVKPESDDDPQTDVPVAW